MDTYNYRYPSWSVFIYLQVDKYMYPYKLGKASCIQYKIEVGQFTTKYEDSGFHFTKERISSHPYLVVNWPTSI